MKQYDTYKPSGIEWLGDIPEHWDVKRIKDFAYTQSGTTPNSSNVHYYENGLFNWVRTTDLNDGELYDVEYKITELALEECRLNFLPINTVLIAMYGGFGTIGKNSILKVSSTINQSVCAILPSKKFDSRYLIYFFKFFRANWKLFADGTRKDPNINQDAIRNLFLYFPVYFEQTAIANYLDTKTAAIDHKIELLTAKAANYKALRRSQINETVCRGLNPNAPLKDSGIEWIGMIPEHWEVKRFKSIANTVKGRNLELSDTYFENSLPNLSLEYLRNESVTFDTYCYTHDKNQRVTTNDMIIIWDGAGVGEILKGKNGFLSSTIAKIVVDKKKYNSEFLYHLRLSLEYILKMVPAGMGIPHLNPQVLNSFNCPCPPIHEQAEIAQYLNEKTTLIDTILANINEQIGKLTQLRKTLINDVVTGKIKVTEE